MLRVFKVTTRVDCKSAESLKGYTMSSTSSGKASETSPPVPPHSTVARVFHWGFIFGLAYGLVKQVDELEELNDRGLLIEEVVFAIVFLGTLLARFVYMRKNRPTALPSSTGKIIATAAKFVHRGMYLSLSMLAVTGLMIGGMFASAIRDGIVLASVLWAHEASYWASINLIVLHMLGALYHRRIRDGVWGAMVPDIINAKSI